MGMKIASITNIIVRYFLSSLSLLSLYFYFSSLYFLPTEKEIEERKKKREEERKNKREGKGEKNDDFFSQSHIQRIRVCLILRSALFSRPQSSPFLLPLPQSSPFLHFLPQSSPFLLSLFFFLIQSDPKKSPILFSGQCTLFLIFFISLQFLSLSFSLFLSPFRQEEHFSLWFCWSKEEETPLNEVRRRRTAHNFSSALFCPLSSLSLPFLSFALSLSRLLRYLLQK